MLLKTSQVLTANWVPAVVRLTLPIAQTAAEFTLHHICFSYEHFPGSSQIQVNLLTHIIMLTTMGENDTSVLFAHLFLEYQR